MKAHVRMHGGTPTLFLDDQPTFANLQLIGGLDPQGIAATQETIRAFARNGIHLYSIDAVVNEWRAPHEYDFSETAARLQVVIEADPDALLLLRMGLETHYLPDDWWNKTYPDEVEVLTDGPYGSASFASEVWRSQVQAFLRAYIGHLRAVGLYDRVIAYQPATGVCGEWIKSWSSMETACGDFSAPMRRAFGAWLRRRYHEDVQALRAAWGDADVSFDSAEVPSTEEQRTTTQHLFRDPAREQKTIDYYACYAETSADALLGFCRTIKEETGGDKLTGAFYGYQMELSWNDAFFVDNYGGLEMSEVSTIQRSGHLGLWKTLRSPDIDFFVSPYTYCFRGIGGDGMPMQPTESLRVHGKLYLLEEDTLMHNNFDPGGRMHPKNQSLPIYQRNFAQVVTHGLGVTWLESSLFVEDAQIRDASRRQHARFQQLGTWALELDRSPRSEVAVVLDDESFYYEAIRNGIDVPLIWQQRVISLSRFGAPHDLYLLNDLLEGRLPEYKLYVFLNPFQLDDQRRAALKEIVCRDGKTALWLYAAGYINPSRRGDAVSPEHMTDLTGLRFGCGGSYWGPFMHITDFAHPVTRGLPQDLFWGTTRHIAPNFFVDDPDATVLGQIVAGLGRCRAGLALKTFGGDDPRRAWTSVYCATPNLPAAVLRGIARHAGVHLYSEEGDVLYATRDLLGVHTVAGGPRRFRLPRHAEVVYDLLDDRLIAEDASSFDVTLPPASSAFYYTGEKERIGSLRRRAIARP